MQLCTLIFGNKPTVNITSPADGQTISDTAITVTGTINDLDGDATKVKVWITDTVLSGWDYDVSSGQFSVNLDLTSLTSGTHTICAQGYDANNNVSDTISVSFTYNGGGGGGSAPIVAITQPANNDNVTIGSSGLTISGTISDADQDASSVTVWLEFKDINDVTQSINQTTTILTEGTFSVTFGEPNIQIPSSGQMTAKAQGCDSKGNYSQLVSTTFNYIISGGSSNLLKNGYFTDSGWINSDITYSSNYAVETYLNQTNGDYLPYWIFFIWAPEEDYPKIDISSGSVRMYTTNPNSNGSAMGMTQDTSSISAFKTGSGKTIKIKFRIDSFAGGSCVSPFFEAPVKINIKSGGSDYTIAAFTTNTLIKDGGYGFGGLQTQTNLEYEFTLPNTALNGTSIPLDQQITELSIWCNGWTWDVTIYFIEVY